MSEKTLEELLDSIGECSVTIWIKDRSTQANTTDKDSAGWSCHTQPSASVALREALETRMRIKQVCGGQAPTPTQAKINPKLKEAVQAAPAPVRRTVVVRRPEPTATPTRRLVRR